MKQRIKKLIYTVTSPLAVRRLERVVREIEKAGAQDVRNEAFLETMIRNIGLRYDRRGLYGNDEGSMNFFSPGMWQIPRQLAGAVALLAKQNVQSFLEIGTADGFTFSFMATCLSRVNPGLESTTIDIAPQPPAARIKFRSQTRFLAGTKSDDFAGESFDLVFIDGNHSYEWVARDYQNVGRYARICMFHDINDQLCGEETVPRFWRELKEAESGRADFHEFLHHSHSKKVMGIGIRIASAPPSC